MFVCIQNIIVPYFNDYFVKQKPFAIDTGYFWYPNIYIYNFSPSMRHPDKIRKQNIWTP